MGGAEEKGVTTALITAVIGVQQIIKGKGSGTTATEKKGGGGGGDTSKVINWKTVNDDADDKTRDGDTR